MRALQCRAVLINSGRVSSIECAFSSGLHCTKSSKVGSPAGCRKKTLSLSLSPFLSFWVDRVRLKGEVRRKGSLSRVQMCGYVTVSPTSLLQSPREPANLDAAAAENFPLRASDVYTCGVLWESLCTPPSFFALGS